MLIHPFTLTLLAESTTSDLVLTGPSLQWHSNTRGDPVTAIVFQWSSSMDTGCNISWIDVVMSSFLFFFLTRGRNLGGTGGTAPPKFEVGGRPCIRPPNILRSSVVG